MPLATARTPFLTLDVNLSGSEDGCFYWMQRNSHDLGVQRGGTVGKCPYCWDVREDFLKTWIGIDRFQHSVAEYM